jgi:hypothetical protein
MSKPKYRKGSCIRTIQELLTVLHEDRRVFFRDQVLHVKWVENMTLRTVYNNLYWGNWSVAEQLPMTDKNQNAVTE